MSQYHTATLLIKCQDRKGLVAAISFLLSEHGINILDLQQHSDDDNIFFQRIYFDISEMTVNREVLESLLSVECARYEMEWRIAYNDVKKRVAIFVSKYEHCLYDLLLRYRLGEFNCEIPLIISNHEDLRSFVEGFGIPYYVYNINKANKAEQEEKEVALLKDHDIDLVVMARYMQILSKKFVSAFPERIINIHHSTLPAFKGAKPYHQAHERGVKQVGATAHYATADLDEGPIIAQGIEDCSHIDSVEDLIRKGRDIERVTLAKAVRAHLADRIIVEGHRTVVF